MIDKCAFTPCPTGKVTPATTPIDDKDLLLDVYASAPAKEKEHIIAHLVGKLYNDAPLALKSHLLEHLMKPLGLLSLMTVANGIFAKIRFKGGWPTVQVRVEDAASVQAGDVTALVDYVQLVSAQGVEHLAQIISTEPMMTGSAVAAVLITILMMRAKNHRIDDV